MYYQKYTNEEIEIAKSANLCELARYYGYTVVKVGRTHSLKEHDSVRIYNQNTFFQNSYGKGGTTIDFLMQLEHMTFSTAVGKLLEFTGYSIPSRKESPKANIPLARNAKEMQEEKKEFVLPERSPTFKRMYAYLIQTRGLSKDTVDYFVRKGLIYESAKRHNIVFLGKDKEGAVKFASQRGTMDAVMVFKGDVLGSDKKYGFNYSNPESKRLRVYEAGIDMMSYMDITKNYRDNYLALGMVCDHPLERYLEEHKQIEEIILSLDNDNAGQKAMQEMEEKYTQRGYKVSKECVPGEFKDWNEYRCATKDNAKLKPPPIR